MMFTNIKNVLILDDEQSELDLIISLLQQHLPARMISTKYPTKALQLARDSYFDIILIDVTLSYNGTQFGGLEVYKSLLERYGNSSLVAYSQYITDELLQRYGLPFKFIEKDVNRVEWIQKLTSQLVELRGHQSCFVAMPFQRDYDELFSVVRSSINSAGYRCVRIDQHTFTQSIVDKIFYEIRNSKLMVFVATDQNPNVFYEAGFAVALRKEVITVTDHFDHLPFDIRDRNTIAYGNDLTLLGETLTAKLVALTDSFNV